MLEVALAGVLEAAALALRSGRGLIGDSAAEIVREIRLCYPGAGLKGREADHAGLLRTPTAARRAPVRIRR